MKTIPNTFASINPATLPLVGGLPCLDLALLDANFAELVAVDTPLIKVTNYVVVQANMNGILAANSAGAIALTLGTGLTSGSWLWIFNLGAGTLTLTATINGVSNPTLAQYEQAFVWTNGTSWFGRMIPATWASATSATNATNATNLTMNGEQMVTGATATTSLASMDVKNGDRIQFAAEFVFQTDTATDVATLAVQKASGTATVTYAGGTTQYQQTVYCKSSATNYGGTLHGVIEVTGDGTLVISATISAGGALSNMVNNIRAHFLKKG